MPMPVAIAPDQPRVSWRRFRAHYIDGLIFAFLGFLVSAPLLLVSEIAWIVLFALVFTVGQVYFFAWIHRRDGRSPCKRLLGIRVVDVHGLTPPRGSLVKRSIPLLLEYFYVIAWVGMMSSDYRQRFGDRWGRTFVIRG